MASTVLKSALVNPPDPRSFGYQAEQAPPPLGLGYIAAALRQEGFQTDLFDFGEERELEPSRLQALGFFDYQLYGFTAYTKNFPAAIDLLSLLRSQNPVAVVVFGGPHASPCATEMLREYPAIDVVVRNEGERPMVGLAKYLTDGLPELHHIPNVTFRPNGIDRRRLGAEAARDEASVSTSAATELPDLDEMPFPARDFRFEPQRTRLEYRRRRTPVEVAYICSSRGCPKKCTFCSIIVMSPRYRLRSVQSLMDEIEGLYATRPFGHISFLDANFFVHPTRTLDFARALYIWKPEITWSGTGTADAICRHAEILAQIGALNCSFLEVGIESGNSEALSRFNKWTTVDQNHKALRLLQAANIDVGLDFIMFDPETTVPDLRQNVSFLAQAELLGYGPPECLYNAMRLYPGTPARDRYVKLFDLREHHLMALIPPFVSEPVGTIFRLVTEYLNRFQKPMNRTITELDARYRHLGALAHATPGSSGRPQQRIAALIIRMNHEPYRFFDRLLSLAEGNLFSDAARLNDLSDSLELRRFDELMQLSEELLARTDMEPDEASDDMSVEDDFSPDDIGLVSKFAAAAELMIVDVQGTVYLIPPSVPPRRLNHTASDIWRHLGEGQSLGETIQRYATLHGCSLVDAGEEIVPFLSDMLDSGFLLQRLCPNEQVQ